MDRPFNFFLGQGQPGISSGEYGFNYSIREPEKLQKYLDRCSPSLTTLQINGVYIQSIQGVRFPVNLTTLNLASNQIKYLNGVQFPSNLTNLNLGGNNIESLEGANFPSTLTTLTLNNNFINSLQGIQFPPNLISLYLSNNEIQNLDGIQFPTRLTQLTLNDNELIHMSGVQFPLGLSVLDLGNHTSFQDKRDLIYSGHNKIKSLNEVKFPPNLTELNLQGNRLETLGRIIEPTPNILHLIELQFPKIVEEYRKKLSKQSQQTEQAALKEISDFNQLSMQNQLHALTSFLREGMEARAQQHAETLKQEGEERGKPLIYVRLISNGMRYPVPLNTTESVQSVLDYMNEHYYISSLVSNCGAMHLYKSDKRGRLTTTRILADYSIQNGDTLNAQCRIMQMSGGGINRTKRLQTIKNKKLKSTKKWSLKYKRSINCTRPRGFSQRQYCKYGRKK